MPNVNRRTLLRASGAAGFSALAVAASAQPAHAEPTDPAAPVPDELYENLPVEEPDQGPGARASAGVGAVLWGSSSADSFRAGEPSAVRRITIHEEMTRLGIPTIRHAFGGWRSPAILAIRSKNHPIRPNYSFAGANGELPGSGKIFLPTTNGIVPDTVTSQLPGTVSGQPVNLQLVRDRLRKVQLTRTSSGAPITVGNSAAGYWRTAWEDAERGKIHLLWMGKNNSGDVQRVLNDTRAAYDVESGRSIVMSHWFTWWDRLGTAGHPNITAINNAYRNTYGQKYFDSTAALWDSRWWNVPEIRPLNIAGRGDNAERRRLGLPPRPFIADDTFHLNSYGNLVIAHALNAKIRGLGWA